MGTPKFNGNYGPSGSRGNNNVGVGIANSPSQAGGSSMTGKAGDIGYIPMASLRPESASTKNVHFQTEVPVVIDYTLCNVALATSSEPGAQDAVLWANSQTVTPGTIVAASLPCFTVIRVTFQGDGTLYLGDG